MFGAIAASPLVPGTATAAVARGLHLEELVRRSAHVVRATPLESYCEWARFGDERRIVTYTRVGVEEPVLGQPDTEVLVRTLGGVVGKIGQVVHGEAALLVGEPCLAFLMQMSDGMLGLTGMAQGHYPLVRDAAGALRVSLSPKLAVLLDDRTTAVARLRDRTLIEARSLVKAVRR